MPKFNHPRLWRNQSIYKYQSHIKLKKIKDFIVSDKALKNLTTVLCYPSELYCESRKGKPNLQKVGTWDIKKVNPIPCLLRRQKNKTEASLWLGYVTFCPTFFDSAIILKKSELCKKKGKKITSKRNIDWISCLIHDSFVTRRLLYDFCESE